MKLEILGLILFALAGCSVRDQIVVVPRVAGAVEHTVLFASNRSTSENLFGETRSLTTTYGQAIVAVPPKHKVGVVEYPSKAVNAQKEFGIVQARTTPNLGQFNAMLSKQISNRPKGERSAIIYVHGFNSTFAEALFLNTQLMHDYKRTEVPILFSWPSSGRSLAYMHDHESILSSRNALETLLDTLERSGLESFTLVAHSMGSQLVMETLRQHTIRADGRHWPKLAAVALISPDIDVQLFTQLSKDMGGLPQPFLVISSPKDKLLGISGVINGSKARLGGIEAQEALPASSKATVVSSSFATDVFSSNHMTAFRSPQMIDYLSAYEANKNGNHDESRALDGI